MQKTAIFLVIFLTILASCASPAPEPAQTPLPPPTLTPTVTVSPTPPPAPSLTPTPAPTPQPLVQPGPGHAVPVEGRMMAENGVDKLGMTEAGSKALYRMRLQELFMINWTLKGNASFAGRYLGAYQPGMAEDKVREGMQKFFADAEAGMIFDNVYIPTGWIGATYGGGSTAMVQARENYDGVKLDMIGQAVMTPEEYRAYANKVGESGIGNTPYSTDNGAILETIEIVDKGGYLRLTFVNGANTQMEGKPRYYDALLDLDMRPDAMMDLIIGTFAETFGPMTLWTGSINYTGDRKDSFIDIMQASDRDAVNLRLQIRVGDPSGVEARFRVFMTEVLGAPQVFVTLE